MKRVCVFPGTFDPVTYGHLDIIKRALPLFDKIIVGIGSNSSKNNMFSPETRKKWLEEIYNKNKKVSIEIFNTLTLNFCLKKKANFILRGIRFVSDFEFEKTIADANRQMSPTIETIFLTSEPKYSSVASTIVREILKNKGDISHFVPKNVYKDCLNLEL